MTLRIAFIALALTFITMSNGASLWVVYAGKAIDNSPTYIAELTNNTASTVNICPEHYYDGFSIECRGSDINPAGGVSFFVNDSRVQTEGVSPPYMAAGDLDRGPDGLTFINPWKDWSETYGRCSTRTTDCVLNIKCAFADVEITKTIVINKFESCVLVHVLYN